MSNIQARETFVKSFRTSADELMQGEIDFEEFGLLQFMSLLTNPYNGELLTNYADLENKLRMKSDRIRYLCKKLKDKKKIWYQLRQGQRGFAKFYVDGFPLANGGYVNVDNYVSEVEARISESEMNQTSGCISVSDKPEQVSYEVSNKDKENENKKEKKKEKTLSQFPRDTLLGVRKEFSNTLAFQEYLLQHGYPKEEVDALRFDEEE